VAKLAIVFGFVLVVLGAVGFIATGSTHMTALIPCGIGTLLALSGTLAITNDVKRRMIWMHVAVTVALLGFLGSFSRAIDEYIQAHGEPLAHPVAVEDQAAMAAICLVFVVLCVRSFISARKARDLGA
jgi:uncharacterized membrane protein